MAGLSDLYQEILLEHNSKPHNFKKVEEADQKLWENTTVKVKKD